MNPKQLNFERAVKNTANKLRTYKRAHKRKFFLIVALGILIPTLAAAGFYSIFSIETSLSTNESFISLGDSVLTYNPVINYAGSASTFMTGGTASVCTLQSGTTTYVCPNVSIYPGDLIVINNGFYSTQPNPVQPRLTVGLSSTLGAGNYTLSTYYHTASGCPSSCVYSSTVLPGPIAAFDTSTYGAGSGVGFWEIINFSSSLTPGISATLTISLSR